MHLRWRDAIAEYQHRTFTQAVTVNGCAKKHRKALDAGAALFVTEWDSVFARGDGRVTEKETLRWMEFLRANQFSHCSWALNDKQASASALEPGASAGGPWPESALPASGRLARRIIRSWDLIDYDGAQ